MRHSTHPCWRELRTVHLGLTTCILTTLQHLGGPADLGPSLLESANSQITNNLPMSTCVLCKPSHHGSHPPPPHAAHTQARGPHPNHPWPGQAQSGPTPHPRATAIKPVNPKLAQGADPDRPSYPEDTPIKAPALSTSIPAPGWWQKDPRDSPLKFLPW